jgi:TPR repeat protein
MRYPRVPDRQQGSRFVKLFRLKLLGAFLALAAPAHIVSAALAGTAEEDFRAGLSAYNTGDFAGAMRLWRPLADRDDARSQAGIGFMYHRGLGVKADDVQAAFWLRKAAEQGQAEGQFMLGHLYYFGLGVPQSYPAAYAWCELAQDNGNAEAQFCRDSALESLTGEAQLRDAFRMVTELRERLRRRRAD